MAEILLNKCYGGYSLSSEAIHCYMMRRYGECYFYGYDETREHGLCLLDIAETLGSENTYGNSRLRFVSAVFLGETCSSDDIYDREGVFVAYDFGSSFAMREDPLLISIVRELGDAANGRYAELEIVNIPDNLAGGNYVIDEYDGIETLHAEIEMW